MDKTRYESIWVKPIEISFRNQLKLHRNQWEKSKLKFDLEINGKKLNWMKRW